MSGESEVVEKFKQLHADMKSMAEEHSQLMQDYEKGKAELEVMKNNGDFKAATLKPI